MKRQDIYDMFDDEQHEKIKGVIDYFENQFKEIAEILNIELCDSIDEVCDAKIKAEKIAGDLY